MKGRSQSLPRALRDDSMKKKSFGDMLMTLLPWWVPAVIADAIYFSPEFAMQLYPPTKSEMGIPVYSDGVLMVHAVSPYLAGFFLILALTSLLVKTKTVHKKAHASVQNKP